MATDARSIPGRSEPPPPAPFAKLRRVPSSATLLVYAGDWKVFRAWCRMHDFQALPAETQTLTAFLAASATQFSPGTLTRRLAAIAEQHRQHGHAWPVDDTVRQKLRELRRADRRRRLPLPLQADELRRMAAGCPGDLPGRRDRALLLLAAAGLSRSALVGLDVENICFTDSGVDLVLPPGRRIACGASLKREPAIAVCPVRNLESWLHASDAAFGPVFRKIDRWGNIEHRRLHTDAIRRIWERRKRRRPLSDPA